MEAAFDRFSPELMRRYLAPYVERDLGIGFEDVLALGLVDGQLPVLVTMKRADAVAGSSTFSYAAEVPATRPQWHFTPRLVPCHPGASVPLEVPFILWNEGRR